MLKTAIWMLWAVGSSLAMAQAPAGKHMAPSKKVTPSRMSASEEATAAAQAAAIAQAAAAAVTSTSASVLVAPAVAVAASPAMTPSALPKPLPGPETVNAEELAIAQRVHQGLLTCELGASIRVEPNAVQPGYFHLQGKGFRYRMRPVVTSTGAIRLEDQKAGAVWLQLANKSMLMDQKKGHRLADECANPEQLAYAESMKTNPPPKLFDTTGMGR